MPGTETTSRKNSAGIDRNTARSLAANSETDIFDLFALSNKIRKINRGNTIDLCSIVNAKSGACPEDCTFCAQSAHRKTSVATYPLKEKEYILEAAASAQECGARRFCIVTSGKSPAPDELEKICSCISEVKALGLMPCATLGLLEAEQLQDLQDAGLMRYHNNLETSEAYFSEICTTHSYRDKVRTIESAKSLGLSVCSGGVFGMGESWEDRIEMAFALKELDVDSIPLNFYRPASGASSDQREMLNPLEALKIIALYRLILPTREIRICGGRPATFRNLQPLVFTAGADGLLIGNYLTTQGRAPEDDLQMILDMGLVH